VTSSLAEREYLRVQLRDGVKNVGRKSCPESRFDSATAPKDLDLVYNLLCFNLLKFRLFSAWSQELYLSLSECRSGALRGYS